MILLAKKEGLKLKKQILNFLKRLFFFVGTFGLYSILEELYFLPKASVTIFLIILTLVCSLSLIGFIYYLYKNELKNKNPWKFNEKPHWSLKRVIIAVLMFTLLIGFQYAYNHFIVRNGSIPKNEQSLNATAASASHLYYLLSIITGPVCEELIFRGLFFNTFFWKKNKFTELIGVVSSGFVFAIIHDSSFGEFTYMYWVLGCILAFTYVWTKDIRYSTLAHILNNLTAALW